MTRILSTAALTFLFAAVSAPAAEPSEEGFVKLFDGQSLDGWFGATDAYEVIDGVLVCKPGGHGKLLTKKEYSDFVFRFEFKLTPAANNGIGLRTPEEGDAAYVGMESQVLDNTADEFANLADYQYHGSIYGVAAAKRGALKPLGEWNVQEIRCVGRKVRVVLNGETIVDTDLDQAAPEGKTIDGRQHPGLAREKGYIGLLSHGRRVDFRNLRVKEVAAE